MAQDKQPSSAIMACGKRRWWWAIGAGLRSRASGATLIPGCEGGVPGALARLDLAFTQAKLKELKPPIFGADLDVQRFLPASFMALFGTS